jgi:hypothetical protein
MIVETFVHRNHKVEISKFDEHSSFVYVPEIFDEWGYEVYSSLYTFEDIADARKGAIDVIDKELYVRDMLNKYYADMDGEVGDIAKYDEELRKSL